MKLIRLLMKLTHEKVTIELKNGIIASGNVAGVERTMNIHLRYVTLTKPSKEVVNVELMTIRGSSIRYVILPDELPLDAMLENISKEELMKTTRQVQRYGQGRKHGRGKPRGGHTYNPSRRHNYFHF